jgi:sigma-70-like protein
MPPRSSATAFDRLAPDQRAAVELVLRQGRSYGELSDLLGMPEETIRGRARSGLTALAPDLVAPARSGEIADWLLGQQSEAHAARTRALLLADPAAHTWAATVAEPLRAVPGGDAVPALPTGPEPEAPRVNGTSARGKTPRREQVAAADDRDTTPARRSADGDTAAAPPPVASPDDLPGEAEPRGRSSRLGGAIIIGAALLLVAVVLVVVLTRGDDDRNPVADAPVATATATASPAISANDIVLKGPAGSRAVGLMRLFRANDDTVRFALAAQGVAPNKSGETYSLWFSKKDGTSQLLGDVKDPVGEKGELTSAGPGNDDVDKFPQWFATYDTILVTLDGQNAKEPGKVILSGDLPHSQTG